jgi:hypothetical protein
MADPLTMTTFCRSCRNAYELDTAALVRATWRRDGCPSCQAIRAARSRPREIAGRRRPHPRAMTGRVKGANR